MALIYVFYVALQISLFTLSPRMFSCKLILVFFGGCNSNKFVSYACELSSKLSYNYGSYKGIFGIFVIIMEVNHLSFIATVAESVEEYTAISTLRFVIDNFL